VAKRIRVVVIRVAGHDLVQALLEHVVPRVTAKAARPRDGLGQGRSYAHGGIRLCHPAPPTF
jgi:hypothetical protein